MSQNEMAMLDKALGHEVRIRRVRPGMMRHVSDDVILSLAGVSCLEGGVRSGDAMLDDARARLPAP